MTHFVNPEMIIANSNNTSNPGDSGFDVARPDRRPTSASRLLIPNESAHSRDEEDRERTPDPNEANDDDLTMTSDSCHRGPGLGAGSGGDESFRHPEMIIANSNDMSNQGDSGFGNAKPEERRTSTSGHSRLLIPSELADRDEADRECSLTVTEMPVLGLTSTNFISRLANGLDNGDRGEAEERRPPEPSRLFFTDEELHGTFNREQLVRVQSGFVFIPEYILTGAGRDRMLFRTYAMWHSFLSLQNPATPSIACVVMKRMFDALPMSTYSMQRTRLSWRRMMAASFWVAVKICDNQERIPPAWLMASMAQVSSRGLIDCELALLGMLNWQPVPVAWLPRILGGFEPRA